jgi:hypothetical protein
VVVTPPPTSIDICQVTPSLAACQPVLPPTTSEPTKPVQVALNQLISAVNKPEQHASSATSASGGGTGGNSAPSTSPDEKKTEAKSDDKSTASKESGMKNESVKKTYCN